MRDRRSASLIAASVLARLPNFVLPILAARALDFPDYSIFALAFATASASSACIGEAIAATISRESHRVGESGNGAGVLAAFFRLSAMAAMVAVALGVFAYHVIRAGGVGSGILNQLSAILLVPAYLLPPAATALANACGLSAVAVRTATVSVPVAIVVSLAFGAMLGVGAFLLSYFVFVVAANLYVHERVVRATPAAGRGADRGDLTALASTFLFVLLPFLLGGPVHGFCLAILGHQQAGVAELALFVAYYPWSMAVSIVSAVLANFAIQRVAEAAKRESHAELRSLVSRLVLGNVLVATFIAACLWLGADLAFALYGDTIARDDLLFNWMLIAGIAAACVNATSQIMIATGRGRALLLCAMMHAGLYVGLAALLVGTWNFGATGLIRALTVSLALLATMHLILIVHRLRERASRMCRVGDAV